MQRLPGGDAIPRPGPGVAVQTRPTRPGNDKRTVLGSVLADILIGGSPDRTFNRLIAIGWQKAAEGGRE